MRTIDIIALIVSAFVTLGITISTLQKPSVTLRPVVAFFMLFGPAVIVVHMIFHIGSINFNTLEKIKQGSFTYDFRYYSLMLMAVAIAYCAGVLLQRIKRFFEGESYKPILKAVATTIFVSAPIIPINPIGALPTIACLITLSAVPFVKKKGKVVVIKKYPKAKSAENRLETISVLKFV
jgi:hypothetical protein